MLVLLVGLQLVYFTGVVSTDDIGYLDVARQMSAEPREMPGETNHLFVRLVQWRLIQLATALVPSEPWAIALPSMLAGVVVLMVVRGLARQHIDPRAAVIAMLGFGLVPVVVAVASTGLPELGATAFGWAAVWLAASCLLSEATRHAALRCLVAGVLIGVAYNVKETAALFGPALLLFVAVWRTRRGWAWHRAGMLVLGAGLWLGFEAVVFWHWTGDPLHHLHALGRSQRAYFGPTDTPTAREFLMDCTSYVRWLADPGTVLAPMGIVLLAGLVFGLVIRKPFARLLLCVVCVTLVYLSVGTTGFGRYEPVCRQPRYIVAVLPGLALLATMMIWRIRAAGEWPRRLVAILAVPLIGLSLVRPNDLSGRWYHARTFAAGYRLIEERGDGFDEGDRLCAAGISWNRFHGLSRWLDCPEPERISATPTTEAEWVERYGGTFVITTRADRRGPARSKHATWTLQGRSLAGLSGFERVARVEPPRDRLSTIWAKLRGHQVPTDPEYAVELWQVPTRAEWQAGSPLGPGLAHLSQAAPEGP